MKRTVAFCTAVGLSLTLGLGCQKDLVNNTEPYGQSIQPMKLSKIYKFINVSFGISDDKIKYDRIKQIIHYGNMQMSAFEMEQAYDNANVYKIKYENDTTNLMRIITKKDTINLFRYRTKLRTDSTKR